MVRRRRGGRERKMAEQTYSITELAQEFDVTTRTIRFYEDQQLLEPLRAGQRRIYSRRDRVRLMLILRGKRIGLSLQEIRELFALYDAASDDAPQLHEFIRILQRKEQQLLEQMEDIKVVLSEISQLRHQCEKTLDRRGADARQST
ncbi:MerR family transcriptional regulator [Chromobacterium haemolyticum]|nr:MerR family transcriptional regulator [Chromobacterium haemolyticum]